MLLLAIFLFFFLLRDANKVLHSFRLLARDVAASHMPLQGPGEIDAEQCTRRELGIDSPLLGKRPARDLPVFGGVLAQFKEWLFALELALKRPSSATPSKR